MAQTTADTASDNDSILSDTPHNSTKSHPQRTAPAIPSGSEKYTDRTPGTSRPTIKPPIIPITAQTIQRLAPITSNIRHSNTQK